MKLGELAERIGASILAPGPMDRAEIHWVYAGDRMSDLLSHVSDTTLLVTNLSNSAVMRLIELMDAPGLCLLNDIEPEEGLVEAANRHGTALLISPYGMYETCGRLYRVLGGEHRKPAE